MMICRLQPSSLLPTSFGRHAAIPRRRSRLHQHQHHPTASNAHRRHSCCNDNHHRRVTNRRQSTSTLPADAPPPPPPPPQRAALALPHHQAVAATNVEIARFALLSAFSLPFVIWLTTFSYDYAYRVEICQRALAGNYDDDDDGGDGGDFLGRDAELEEARSLLDGEPSQIVVVAGGNEVGECEQFIDDLIFDLQTHRVLRGTPFALP